MSSSENQTEDLTMFHSFAFSSGENSSTDDSIPTTPSGSDSNSSSLDSKKRPHDSEGDSKEDEHRSKEAKMADNLDESLVLELSWPLKKQIFCTLIDHSELLYGKLVSVEQKKELTNQNQQLIQQLMCLPIQQKPDLIARKKIKLSKSQENLQENLQGAAAYQTMQLTVAHRNSVWSNSNRLVLELDWKLREKVIASLINNHNFAVLHAGSIGDEVKRKLINENNKLIQCLMSLAVSLHDGEDEPLEGELNETEIEWDASALAGLSNTKSATQLIQYSNQTSNETHSSTASGKSNSEQSTVDLANIREELNSMQHMFREVIQHEIRPFLESKVSAADFKAQFKANLGKVCSFSVTGRNCVLQESFHCVTCGILAESGVCKSCVRVCHKDHEVVKKPTVANFCDCSSLTRKCETLVYLYDTLK